MANLAESSTWENGVYQLEEADPVQGGANGIDNLQAKQLANRTKYLKDQVETQAAGKLAKAEIATQLQAQTGTDNQTWMSPLRVAQAIAVLGAIAAATETTAGKVELASAAETLAGTDMSRATHPSGVNSAIQHAIAELVSNIGMGGAASIDVTDVNDHTIPGGFYYVGVASGDKPSIWGHMIVSREGPSGNTARQIWQDGLSPSIFFRSYVEGTGWSAWKKIIDQDALDTALTNISNAISSLVSGKQTVDATLTALSGLVTASNQMIYSTGPDSFSMTALSAFCRTLLGSADQSAFRINLGLGDLSTHNLAQDFASYFSDSGYQKLPSGYIEQWGVGTVNASGDLVITFPIAFTSACYNIIGISGQNLVAAYGYSAASITGATIPHYNTATGAKSSGGFSTIWRAIGK